MQINKIKWVTYPLQYVLIIALLVCNNWYRYQFYPTILYVAYFLGALCLFNAILFLGPLLYNWMKAQDRE